MNPEPVRPSHDTTVDTDQAVEAAATAAAQQARRSYYEEIAQAEQDGLRAVVVGAGTRGNTIAAALADAFLAVPVWEAPHLEAAAERVVGRAARWISSVVNGVVTAYGIAPADRPRELARYIARLSDFRESMPGAPGGRPGAPQFAVVQRSVAPTRMVRQPFHCRRIDDVGELARFLGVTDLELDWFADRRDMNRRANSRQLQHYNYRWLNGRLIEAPKFRLRALQRRLLADIVGLIPMHPAVHGFVPGRSPHTFAAPHAGRRTVIRLDITSFFGAITAARIYGIFRIAGYPEPVAHALAALCCTRTPGSICRSAPASTPDRDFRLALLRGAHLPQGAPTSPALANVGGFRLDRRLAGLARSFDASYTRYADDLAFSGNLGPAAAMTLVARTTEITADEGFRINAAKTRIRDRADRQFLAGLVVNAAPAVPRTEYDALRALLHNAAQTGLEEQNRAGHADLRSHVSGRIAWVGHRNPARAAKLARLLAEIPDVGLAT